MKCPVALLGMGVAASLVGCTRGQEGSGANSVSPVSSVSPDLASGPDAMSPLAAQGTTADGGANAAGAGAASVLANGNANAPAPSKPGMVWIPPGTLRAGTPPDRTPRVADEELPGTPLALDGYFIDLLPFPNESGAIPTINVSRDEAARLCETKKKRLCTEVEWERACKGPANTTYEYGDTYRASVCGTGVSVIQSARRPSGVRVACKSGFGVLDMHGGAWEWTDSPWTRGAASPREADRSLYVLRGGNAEAGELAGRCANALARRGTSKSPSMGFRCCAGAKNEVSTTLQAKKGPSLERSGKPSEHAQELVPLATKTWGNDGAGAFVPKSAWTWRPVANEEIRITSGCAHPPDVPGDKSARCGVLVARVLDPDVASSSDTAVDGGGDGGDARPRVQVLAAIDSGHQLSDVVLFGNPKLLRMWGVDAKGAFVREFSYAYGRVTLADPKRH